MNDDDDDESVLHYISCDLKFSTIYIYIHIGRV